MLHHLSRSLFQSVLVSMYDPRTRCAAPFWMALNIYQFLELLGSFSFETEMAHVHVHPFKSNAVRFAFDRDRTFLSCSCRELFDLSLEARLHTTVIYYNIELQQGAYDSIVGLSFCWQNLNGGAQGAHVTICKEPWYVVDIAPYQPVCPIRVDLQMWMRPLRLTVSLRLIPNVGWAVAIEQVTDVIVVGCIPLESMHMRPRCAKWRLTLGLQCNEGSRVQKGITICSCFRK